MNNNVDLDVTNYTSDELFTILELNEEYATKEDVIDKTDTYIQQFKKDKNADMANFFQDNSLFILIGILQFILLY